MSFSHVHVSGGSLEVELLEGTSEPVLAIHGISSQRRLWNWLRAETPDVTLLAVDLRGRAGSLNVAGPSSVQQHAEDMVAVLDHFGLPAAHVVGMSMGGFVAVELAARFPSRVKSLVLVDGGPPMRLRPGLSPDNLREAFAPRLSRLEQRWASTEEYAAFFAESTSPLIDLADPLLTNYLEHDLQDGRVRLSGNALLEDAETVFFGPNRLEEVTVPMRWLVAEFSVGPGKKGAYDDEILNALRHRFVSVRQVDGVDHAGSIMTRKGAAATAELLAEALSGSAHENA